MAPTLLKVVLDTSVMVAGLRSRHGFSNRVLQLAYLRKFRVVSTPALFLEYEEVLSRPEHCLVHGMTTDRISEFLTGLAAIIEPVRIYFQWRPQPQDTDDEMVLETAINAGADAIVTHNVKDFESIAPRFGLRVLRPGELLTEVSK